MVDDDKVVRERLAILFLDFDGVLIPFTSAGKKMRPAVPDQSCIDNLNSIVRGTMCKIVISSEWSRRNDVRAMRRCLESWGFEYSHRILGSVAWSDGLDREWSITEWLKQNEHDSFVCLDDAEFRAEDLRKRTVTCDPLSGLTMDKTQAAVDMLREDVAR